MCALPVVRAEFLLAGIKWGRHWRIFGRPILQRHGGSRIILGDYLALRSTPRSNPLSPHQPVLLSTRTKGSQITIGHHCGLTGVVVVAASSVTIGDRVLIGSNAVIADTDFHPLAPEDRLIDINAGKTEPIVICDDVFIGTQAMILKGVTIGAGAVVGARSVVTRDVPPGAIVAGNPARIIGSTK